MENLTPITKIISLKGKLAIVTGASAGIGRGIATRLAEAGADLILISRTKEDLEDTKKELSKYKVEIQTFAFDLGVKKNIENFWQKISDQTPDILVNNVGIYPFRDFLEGKEEEYQRVLDVNLHSAYRMSLHFIKRLKSSERTGNILNIGSIEAIMPLKEGLVDYAISKAGVAALTRSLARDFGKDNIRVNAILPGGIKTRGTTEIAKDIRNLNLGLLKTGYNFNQRLPLGRMGQPDDIARMALVMVSELSSFMTGAIIPVDGGFLSS